MPERHAPAGRRRTSGISGPSLVKERPSLAPNVNRPTRPSAQVGRSDRSVTREGGL
jgi:hypothetical protein